MTDSYSFDKDAAQRISNAVKFIEKVTRNPNSKGKRQAVGGDLGFKAKITDGDGKKYSWVAMKYTDSEGMEEDEDWGTGDHEEETGYAVEGIHQSEHVLKNAIVDMKPAMGQDYYVFDYAPGVWTITIDGTADFSGGSADVKYDGTNEVEVFHHFSGEVTDGTNDVGGIMAYGKDGKWWLIGLDCETE